MVKFQAGARDFYLIQIIQTDYEDHPVKVLEAFPGHVK
jgi:hypothetical protein